MMSLVDAIRTKVGRDFELQDKTSATENCNAMNPGEPHGNTIQDSVLVVKMLEQAGVDAIHVSSGGYFPHPRNPAGDLPIEDFVRVYDSMISSRTHTFRNCNVIHDDHTATIFRNQRLK